MGTELISTVILAAVSAAVGYFLNRRTPAPVPNPNPSPNPSPNPPAPAPDNSVLNQLLAAIAQLLAGLKTVQPATSAGPPALSVYNAGPGPDVGGLDAVVTIHAGRHVVRISDDGIQVDPQTPADLTPV